MADYTNWIMNTLKWLRKNEPLIKVEFNDKEETLPMSSTNKKD